MRRRGACLVVVVGLVASGCSGDAQRPELGAPAVSGALGPDTPTANGSTTTVTGDPRHAPSPDADPTPTSTGPAIDPADPVAATGSLDLWLDALAAQDFSVVAETSTAGPAMIGRIRQVVARINGERGGTTELRYTERAFEETERGDGFVRFAGAAVLESVVSGPAGDPKTDVVTFTDPVVQRDGARWVVANVDVDGAPIAHHGSEATHDVDDVSFRLEGGVSFGEITAITVTVVTSAQHEVSFDEIALDQVSGDAPGRRVGALAQLQPSVLYLAFDRVDSAPVKISFQVTLDGGEPRPVSLEFSA